MAAGRPALGCELGWELSACAGASLLVVVVAGAAAAARFDLRAAFAETASGSATDASVPPAPDVASPPLAPVAAAPALVPAVACGSTTRSGARDAAASWSRAPELAAAPTITPKPRKAAVSTPHTGSEGGEMPAPLAGAGAPAPAPAAGDPPSSCRRASSRDRSGLRPPIRAPQATQ
ncbi:MAG TPA: hypothetical protein VGX51_06100 [Solirubrobacteraceae bacterium]|nr:hypothetical protein [Solirubrobacteraceae bacterium]